ncbi:hypothetical protein [Cupriavidus sp. CP313]
MKLLKKSYSTFADLMWPISLITAACTVALFSESELLFFVISGGVAAAVAAKWITYLRKPAKLELSDFFAVSILSAYGMSTFLAEGNLVIDGFIGGAASYFGYDQDSLSLALAVVLCSSSVLMLYGIFFPFRLDNPSAWGLRHRSHAEYFVLAAFFFVSLAFATGSIGFQANLRLSDESNEISVFGAVASQLLAPAGTLGFYLIAARSVLNKRGSIVLYIVSIVMAVLMVSQGRRMIVYMVILCVLALRFGNLGARVKNKMVIFYFLLISVGCIGVFLFFAMRIASYDSAAGSGVSELLTGGMAILSQDNGGGLVTDLGNNVTQRSFVIGYLADINERASSHRWLDGEALWASIKMILPSLIVGKKDFPVDEELVNPALGLPVVDQANSVITTGLADFGLFGAIFYPLLVVTGLRLFLKVVMVLRVQWMILYAWFAVLFLLLNVEASVTSYLAAIRNQLLVVASLYCLYVVVKRKRLRARVKYVRG